MGFSVALLVGLSAPATAGISTPIRNCPDERPATLEVLSPVSGQAYSGPIVRVEIRTGCPGKFGQVPMVLSVDGVPYYPKKLPHDTDQLFVPSSFTGNLPCCQTGGKGLLEFRLKVRPGDHVLTVGPGYQGTNLPSFDKVSVAFSVGSALPTTGIAATPYVWIGLACILIGALAQKAASQQSS